MFLLSTLSITIMLSYSFIIRVENNKVFLFPKSFFTIKTMPNLSLFLNKWHNRKGFQVNLAVIKQRDDNQKLTWTIQKEVSKNTQDDVYWIQAMTEFQVTFWLFLIQSICSFWRENKLVVCQR